MSMKVAQIVDPETGKIVAEKRVGLLGDPIYRSPSEKWIRRAARRSVRVYALISTVLSVVILLLEEFSPYYAELAFSEVGAIFVPGILLAFWWGIRAIKEAVERDETIRYAKHVGKEKEYHIVDPDTGKKETSTFLVVTDNISCTDAFAPELEPERSIEQAKIDTLTHTNGNTARRMCKEWEYHIVDPKSGRTVAYMRDSERILQEDAAKSNRLRIIETVGAASFILICPFAIFTCFVSGKIRTFLLYVIAILMVISVVMGFARAGISWINKRKLEVNSNNQDLN